MKDIDILTGHFLHLKSEFKPLKLYIGNLYLNVYTSMRQ